MCLSVGTEAVKRTVKSGNLERLHRSRPHTQHMFRAMQAEQKRHREGPKHTGFFAYGVQAIEAPEDGGTVRVADLGALAATYG